MYSACKARTIHRPFMFTTTGLPLVLGSRLNFKIVKVINPL